VIDYKSELISSLDFTKVSLNKDELHLCGGNGNYANLLFETTKDDEVNQEMYDTEKSVTIYRNFLTWLFSTFEISEDKFRKDCIKHLELHNGEKVLVTSCGLGEDVAICCDAVGDSGFVHAQDLSLQFIDYVAQKTTRNNVVFTVSNALHLPYKDNYFDAVYHFGGINLFGDIKQAISEMNRVGKVGGRILFGDESVALHLRETDYGKMFIKNNKLWESYLPLEYLPLFANNIWIRYVLGNCFFLIGFEKHADLPDVNIDVEHIGHRGGSVRKRYFGELEGVDETLKNKMYDYAKENKKSVSRMLENMIREL